MTRDRAIATAVLVLTALAGYFTFDGLVVRNEIADFVPNAEERELAEVAREVTDSELSRTIVLNVGPGEASEVATAAGELGDALRDAPGIAWVRSGPSDGMEQALYTLYFARRYAFLAETPANATAALTDAGLAQRANDLRHALAGPMSILVRRIAAEDPLQAFPGLLTRAQDANAGGPEIASGHFITSETADPQGRWGVVVLSTTGSVFSADAQEPVLHAIDDAFARVHAAHPSLRLEQAGVQRFAVRTERALRADTQRISTLSMVGIVVLFVLLLRGPRFLFLGAIPLAVGTVLATASARLLFGSVHGITLAFGSSMLGVGIDFVAHYVNHHVLHPEGSAEDTMKKLWPGLALGATTTIAGLFGLAWTSFPGMRELAVFAGLGVLGSLVATRWLVPPFMPATIQPTRLHLFLARICESIWRRTRDRRSLAIVLPLIATVISIAGLSRARFLDDLRALNPADPALVAEDRAVRSRVAQGEAGRFVIAYGDDDDDALAANDAAYAALTAARDAGELTRFRSAHPFLPSPSVQRAIDDAVRTRPNLASAMLDALERAGFVRAMFDPFTRSIAAPAPSPLTYDELAATPAVDVVRPFRIHAGSRVAYLSFVEGVHDADALDRRFAGITGARYFDQARFLSSAYRTFREHTIELVLAGLVVVFGLCLLRYRKLTLGLAAVGPAVLASATSLALVSLAGEPLSLMHLVACMLVLSMAEDYAVFLLEVRDEEDAPGITLVGLLTACVMTVLSFGLLALSEHPALRALGLVTSIGVLLSMLMAPLALLAVRPAKN
jgi:predicted exporter